MHLCGPLKPHRVRTPRIAVQLDNLNTQNTPLVRKFCSNNDIFILNTSENCTDVRALNVYTATQMNPFMNLIKSDTNSVTKIAFFAL